MADLTLQGLRVFRAVAQSESFSAAAKKLDYTQSAISRQVATLEAAVGATLFLRTNRGVKLTPPGMTLAGHAASVLDELETAQRQLSAEADPSRQRLRIGAFPTAMAALLPRAAASLRAEIPNLQLQVREGTSQVQMRRLRAGKIEAAVVGRLNGSEAGAVALSPLLDDPLFVAVGRTHRLATTSSVEADELEPEGWVVGSKDPGEGLLGAWEENDWSPRINFVVRDWMAKLGLVAAGLGVTLVPGLSAAVVPDEIALVRIADQRASRPVSLARPVGDDANPTIDAAADAFRSAAGEIALEVDRRR